MNVSTDKIIEHTIMRGVVGSTAHGLNLPGTDDRDEMGVCIEPIEYTAGFTQFEQTIYRTAEDRRRAEIAASQASGNADHPILHKDGHTPRSQPGDLDLVIYSLRKYVRLALKGNPTIIGLLFLPNYSILTSYGEALRSRTNHLLSRRAGKAFLGYIEAQRQRLVGERGGKHGQRVTNPEVGYDTKYAMHMLRLGFQGVKLLATGKLVLPMDGWPQEFLMKVRRGEVELKEVLSTAIELEHKLKGLLTTSCLPEHPDDQEVEQWVLSVYKDRWGCHV